METVTKCCPTRTRRIVPENGVVTTSTEYDYNPANQLESWTESNGAGGTLRSALIGFDERRNRDTQTVTLPGGIEKTTQYDWDFQNRLVGVTDPQGGAHAYAYDYRTRRIARSEPGGATAVSWSGGLSLAEYPVTGLQGAVANPLSPQVEYRRGPDMGGGIGGLLHSLRDGAPKYNLGNGRGDVVAQSDQSGALTWTASYEAFGTRPLETGNNADRQRANTKEEDPTGLLWEHFRYRDLETGVWLSRDPAGFVDGPNLYAYVNQNPWSKFDPLGLEKESTTRRVVRRIAQVVKGALGDPGRSDRSPVSSFDTSWMDRSVASLHPQSVDSVEGVVDMGFTTAGIASLPLAKPTAPKASSPKPTGGVISGVVEETPGSSALITKVKTEAEVVATKTPEVGDKVTRHWGGNSGPDGQSWTREPATAQTRENLGLGKSNTGEFVSEGTLVETTGVTSRRAKEWDGFSGGGDEVLVPDPRSQIKLESVRMPDEPLPDK